MKRYLQTAFIILIAGFELAQAQPSQPVIKKTLGTPLPQGTNTTVINRPVTLQPVFIPGSVEMCVDRPVLNNSLPARDFSAVQAPPRINSDGSVSNIGVTRQPLAGETLKMWNPGQTIAVFISSNGTSEFIRSKVKFYAQQWERIANIKLAFVDDFRNAQIKVEFDKDNRSWSWIGKDVLFNPLGFYTMHYGSFNETTQEATFKRIIEHEFGHALGFIHEHQSPAAGIQWDKEKVYAYFAEAPNKWSRADVDFNLFAKYANTTTNHSTYDPLSIMHYKIPAELTLNGVGTPVNWDFSSIDVQYAGQIYPFPVSPGASAGTLRTGDDCDMVDFKVEYNAVPSDKVEFVLELGKLDNKTVTWWKQIGIPMKNGTETSLWVQNHSLIASENRTTVTVQVSAADINKGVGISFWKAKFLGVHTLLPFRWNVLSAIPGGSRVRLVWTKDVCG